MTSLSPSVSARPHDTSILSGLWPVVLAVFLGFLAISVPLAALSLALRDRLGFGTFTVGRVIGLQSLATLLTRHQAGTLCDRRGPRVAVLIGFPLAALADLAYVAAGALALAPAAGLGVLILGRLLMGLGEACSSPA